MKRRTDSISGLYLVTDRHALRSGVTLIAAVEAALEATEQKKDAPLSVQLREKDLGGKELLELALSLRTLTRRFRARLIINDRVDIAALSQADGVHLGVGGLPIADARAMLGDNALVGVSTHNKEEARRAQDEGADFITLGPVFHTPSKLRYGEPIGLKTLKEVATAARIPVFAIGGIDIDNVGETLSAGASGTAVIRAVFAAADIKKSTGELLENIAVFTEEEAEDDPA